MGINVFTSGTCWYSCTLPNSCMFCCLSLIAHGMWQLFHMMPLLIGDRIPFDDDHYKSFMLLQEISSILCTDVVTVDHPPYLRVLIDDYLNEFVRLHPNRPLTPKCHYLVHCPTFIKR